MRATLTLNALIPYTGSKKILNDYFFRDGSRTAATSKVELFVTIVIGWKPLTIITKSSTLNIAVVLDLTLLFPPLYPNSKTIESNSILSYNSLDICKNYIFLENSCTCTVIDKNITLKVK